MALYSGKIPLEMEPDEIENYLYFIVKKDTDSLSSFKHLVYGLRKIYKWPGCRTEAMGGRIEQCEHYGHEQILYNSCMNRHCPKCGSIDRERWLENR